MKTPLYNHTSEETCVSHSGYPYGSLRCNIRFWLEKKDGRGFRFCSRTQNPKNGAWNKTKTSIYMSLAGCLLQDENGHIGWEGLSQYNSCKEIAEFVRDFPQADFSELYPFVAMKAEYYKRILDSGLEAFTINGAPRKPLTERASAEYEDDIELLNEALRGMSAMQQALKK